MKTLLIETAYKNPKRYSVKNKLDTVLIIGEDEAVINKQPLHDVVEIIEYAYNNLLAVDGNILIRLVARDYGDVLSVFEEKLPALLENYIGLDRIEFIAQCINEQIPKEYCAIPFVETLLIGIGSNKKPELKNKVRFISMPDKLVKLPDSDDNHPFYQWTFWDVPFTREECLAQENFADVENTDIRDLHNYNYVPLNNSQKNKRGMALGEFMELSGNNFQGVPQYWLDQERHYFGQATFDLFTNYLIATEGSPLPDPSWQVIDDDAIVFNNQDPTKIESLLIVQPSTILIPDNLDARDCMTAIQVKQEWKERVDIAYIYFETRKPEFLDQFYYYLNLRAGVAINAATILKTKIEKLPSINKQRKIVSAAKEQHLKEQHTKLDSLKAILNLDEKRQSLVMQLSNLDQELGDLKRKIVDDDSVFHKAIEQCYLISESVREEVKKALYYILPLKKGFDHGYNYSTSEIGNKIRKVLEGVTLTLKDNQLIISSLDLGAATDQICFICRHQPGLSLAVAKNLQENLCGLKKIGDSESHTGSWYKVQSEELLKAISVLVDLMDWLEFFLKEDNSKETYSRNVKDVEMITDEGYLRRSDLVGVITKEWLTKDGKKKGAWVVPFNGSGKDFKVPMQKIIENKLGFGSIVKVDVIDKGQGWETENIQEVINQCPLIFKFKSYEYIRKKNDK